MPTPTNTPPPVAPAVAAAAPVPIATPSTAAPKPSASSTTSPPRDKETGKFTPKPTPPPLPVKNKQTVSAQKALGLKESPSKTAASVAKDLRASFRKEAVMLPEDSSNAATVAETTSEPHESASPADSSPSAPVATPEVPNTPAQPSKVKIGDKEFSVEELEAALREKEELDRKLAAAQQQQTQPQPQPPAPPAPPAPTAEEIAQKEAEWIAATANQFNADISEQDLEAILNGGPDAVKTFKAIRQRDMASAVLHARKGIAEALNPILERVFNSLQPVIEQHDQVQRYTVTQQFVAKHKDFEPHIDLATQVAEKLMEQYPAEVKKMSTDQFLDEVARQTDSILTREWNRFKQPGTWRDAHKKPATAPAPVSSQPQQPPAAPAAVQTPTAPPAPPAAPALKPLVGNAPQPSAANRKSWNQQVAASLTGGRR